MAIKVHALIPAAGRAARYGTAENKILAALGGRAVISRTVGAFLDCKEIDSVTLVCRAGEIDHLRAILAGLERSYLISFCLGADSRQASVGSGLAEIANRGAQPDDLVLVHDAARPLVSTDLIQRCIRDAVIHGSAVAAYPLVDTIKRVEPESLRVKRTVPRDNLWSAQTPQAATLLQLQTASENADRAGFVATDESSLLEQLGIAPHITMGESSNIKITTPGDLALAEALLAASRQPGPGPVPARPSAPPIRVGTGYDIHQLVPGRRLILGGVEIPYEKGLLGHSDADVLLHAICDALLGAAALPDIGHLFPNDDPAYSGASSLKLLEAVRGEIIGAGYVIGNIDACLIAEQPKISPYAPAMKRNISAALQIAEDAIGIKATTNEKIGSLGAGDGIACHATALIMRIH